MEMVWFFFFIFFFKKLNNKRVKIRFELSRFTYRL